MNQDSSISTCLPSTDRQSERLAEVRRPSTRRRVTGSDLHVFMRLQRWLLALDARFVEHIVEASEVRSVPCGNDGLHRLEVAGRTWAGWDLAQLLGAEPGVQAWVLLRLHGAGRAWSLALGVQTCLSVDRLERTCCDPLPLALIPGRPGLLRASFASGRVAARLAEVTPLGLVLNLDHLWLDDELIRAAQVAV